MKNILTLIAVSLLLTACSKHSSDAQVRQMLPGTWVVSSGGSVQYTNIIGADTRYAYQHADPKTGSVVDFEGTLQVSDGYLMDTMTKCSRTNVQVPHVYRGRIVRADSREMVFAFDGGTSAVQFRKVLP
jgi:hypothetical protein